MDDALQAQFKIHKKQEEVIKNIRNRFPNVSQEYISKIISIQDISTLQYLLAKVLFVETLDDIEWEELKTEFPKYALMTAPQPKGWGFLRSPHS